MNLQSEVLSGRKRPPLWIGAAVAAAIVFGVIWLRLGLATRLGYILPIGYGVPLVIVATLRRRSLLWTSAFVFLIFAGYRYLDSPDAALGSSPQTHVVNYWVAGWLVIMDLVVVAMVAHLWITIADRTERQNELLELANAELVTREEEIARSNEELQSQTEELERQSEELRVANEELASREKVLQILLDLSRALKAELARNETMTRHLPDAG